MSHHRHDTNACTTPVQTPPTRGTAAQPPGQTLPPIDRLGLLGLLWRAVFTGLVTSLLLGLLVMLLPTHAMAGDAGGGLRLYGASGEDVGPAPQLRTDVSIRVSGMLARVRVEQRFRNPGPQWVEGIYTFPLPEDAAVDRLRMRYAGRVIEGEIQERAEARRTYDQARAAGRGASLIDQQRANIFTTSVANIPPGAEVQVAIEYQHPVGWRDGDFSLRFPMVVGPRYIAGAPLTGERPGLAGRGWAAGTDQVPDAARITPPVIVGAGDDVNPLALTAELDIGLPLTELTSPYHAITVERPEPGRYRVWLAQGQVPAQRDFVLRWRPALAQQPSGALFTETWRDHRYALLMLMPPAAAAMPAPVARELVLVVDTSGSMHGDSLTQARAALLSALGHLRPGDRFNVIQFNHATEALFDRAEPADARNLARARRYVAGLSAEGGTEMLPAMQLALHDPQPSGLLRQVVFLTDGAIGNEAALFETVAREIGTSRLFTVGIGSAPNGLFMRKAAAFGRGTFTYIGSGLEVGQQVGALFRQLGAPVLTDVQLHWHAVAGEVVVQQAPQAVPDLYAGEPLVVAVQGDTALQWVEVTGRLGGRPWRQRVALHGGDEGRGVHALWARRMIDDRLARLVTGEPLEQVRDEVLALALGHHLVSRYTSLVAVDRTPSRPPGSGLATAAVPSRLPAGWSADAVFGRLPGTATPAVLYLLIGLSGLAMGWLLRRRAG